MTTIYLEDLSEDNLPKNKQDLKKIGNTIIQKPSTLADYTANFPDNMRLEDIWDKIYVFVYGDKNDNREILMLQSMKLSFKQRRRFGFKTNEYSMNTIIPESIQLPTIDQEPKQIDSSESFVVKSELQDLIGVGGMPWSYGRIEAIHRQNQLNSTLDILSENLPELRHHEISTCTLNEMFNKLYKIA